MCTAVTGPKSPTMAVSCQTLATRAGRTSWAPCGERTGQAFTLHGWYSIRFPGAAQHCRLLGRSAPASCSVFPRYRAGYSRPPIRAFLAVCVFACLAAFASAPSWLQLGHHLGGLHVRQTTRYEWRLLWAVSCTRQGRGHCLLHRAGWDREQCHEPAPWALVGVLWLRGHGSVHVQYCYTIFTLFLPHVPVCLAPEPSTAACQWQPDERSLPNAEPRRVCTCSCTAAALATQPMQRIGAS